MIGDLLALTAALSAIIALRYLAVAGAAHWLVWGRAEGLGRRLNRRAPEGPAMRREILHSLVSSPIYAFPAALVLELHRRGLSALYDDPMAHGLWWLILSGPVFLLAQDAYYYWLHRLLHQPRLFALAHRSHHLSREPTAFASFAFDPLEAALTAWFLPAMAMIVPLNLWVALVLLLLMTLAATLNHAGAEVWPERMLDSGAGRLLITARHHAGHHRRLNQNFGLYFTAWDRLMGTNGT